MPLPPVFASYRTSMFSDHLFTKQRAHCPTHIRRMLGTCFGNTWPSKFGSNHVAVGLLDMFDQVQQYAVLNRNIDLW